jgi:hypothetical protein
MPSDMLLKGNWEAVALGLLGLRDGHANIAIIKDVTLQEFPVVPFFVVLHALVHSY